MPKLSMKGLLSAPSEINYEESESDENVLHTYVHLDQSYIESPISVIIS